MSSTKKNQNELSQLLCSDVNTSLLTARVSHGEVRTAVRSLKTGKSPVLDRIFNEHIFYGGEFVFFVTYTMQYCIDPNIYQTNGKQELLSHYTKAKIKRSQITTAQSH